MYLLVVIIGAVVEPLSSPSTRKNGEKSLKDILTLLNVNDKWTTTRRVVEFNKTKRFRFTRCLLILFRFFLFCYVLFHHIQQDEQARIRFQRKISRMKKKTAEESKRKEAKLLREYIIFIEIAFFSISIKHINPLDRTNDFTLTTLSGRKERRSGKEKWKAKMRGKYTYYSRRAESSEWVENMGKFRFSLRSQGNSSKTGKKRVVVGCAMAMVCVHVNRIRICGCVSAIRTKRTLHRCSIVWAATQNEKNFTPKQWETHTQHRRAPVRIFVCFLFYYSTHHFIFNPCIYGDEQSSGCRRVREFRVSLGISARLEAEASQSLRISRQPDRGKQASEEMREEEICVSKRACRKKREKLNLFYTFFRFPFALVRGLSEATQAETTMSRKERQSAAGRTRSTLFECKL